MHLFVCNGTEIQDIKGQKLRIGNGDIGSIEDVKAIAIPANPNNKYYVASGGLFDQIGDRTGKPFG